MRITEESVGPCAPPKSIKPGGGAPVVARQTKRLRQRLPQTHKGVRVISEGEKRRKLEKNRAELFALFRDVITNDPVIKKIRNGPLG
jgi:hypothetical protein